jgi:hypothetical protein
MHRSTGFASRHEESDRAIRPRFHYAYAFFGLSFLLHVRSRRSIIPKVRHGNNRSRHRHIGHHNGTIMR